MSSLTSETVLTVITKGGTVESPAPTVHDNERLDQCDNPSSEHLLQEGTRRKWAAVGVVGTSPGYKCTTVAVFVPLYKVCYSKWSIQSTNTWKGQNMREDRCGEVELSLVAVQKATLHMLWKAEQKLGLFGGAGEWTLLIIIILIVCFAEAIRWTDCDRWAVGPTQKASAPTWRFCCSVRRTRTPFVCTSPSEVD